MFRTRNATQAIKTFETFSLKNISWIVSALKYVVASSNSPKNDSWIVAAAINGAGTIYEKTSYKPLYDGFLYRTLENSSSNPHQNWYFKKTRTM